MTREDWIRSHVEATSEIELHSEEPWATVLRVPLANDGAAWFKACEPMQAFEPGLTARLYDRHPELLPTVLAHDEDRAWLLLADAGTPLRAFGDELDAWLEILPRYAELQRGEITHADEHLAAGVPDQRPNVLPAAYEHLLGLEVGLDEHEMRRLRAFAPQFAELCARVTQPPSIQHDDLHDANVYVRDGRIAVLDWGDAAIGDPFASMLVLLRVVEYRHSLEPGDPWFGRLRGAYLEPWGHGLEEAFAVSQQVAAFSRACTWLRMDIEGVTRSLRRFLDEVVQE